MNPVGPEETQVLVYLARLEGKLDTALAHHGARLEEQSGRLVDHETRLRIVEARDTVTPRQLWSVASGLLLTVGIVTPFLVPYLNPN